MRLNTQEEPSFGQVPEVITFVGVTGSAGGVPLFPSPAFHRSTWRIEPELVLSTYASLVPSRDRTGEVRIAPVGAVVVW